MPSFTSVKLRRYSQKKTDRARPKTLQGEISTESLIYNSFPIFYKSSLSPIYGKKNPPALSGGCCGPGVWNWAYFCQVRFLWRFALRRLRRLCFDIFRRRFFLRFPMVKEFVKGHRATGPSPCKARIYANGETSYSRGNEVSASVQPTWDAGSPVKMAAARR